MWARYERALAARPILTKSSLGFCIASVADCIAQRSFPEKMDTESCEAAVGPEQSGARTAGEGAGGELNMGRVLAFAAFGGLWSGPVNHHWLGLLARYWSAPRFSTMQALAGKVAVQHTFFNPLLVRP
jgi:hypothetical protein